MSDQTPRISSQQTLVVALAVVAVLLAALVGVLIYQQAQTAKLASLATPTAVAPGTSPAPSTSSAPVAFDAATATKVPAGMTPDAMVKAYHEDIVAGKYDASYKLLPLANQKSYGDPAAYATQLKSYGITGYKLGKLTTTGDTAAIVAEEDTPSMPITYTWKFKKVGSQWYVESRAMGGAVQ